MSTNDNLSNRISELMTIISAGVYEKENVFKLAMLSLLAGESCFLLGLPGIAKSLISRRIKYVLHQGSNFEYLMHRFSTPEEIFGPISIKDLLKGNYIRLTNQYLPAVDIVFLDEIWKAGPAIQNTLLTIINEKIFRNGGVDVKVPMKLLISASNELPENGKGLEALFDRFIVRIIVEGLTKTENFNEMLNTVTNLEVKVPPTLQIKSNEYQKWLTAIENEVTLSNETLAFIARFRQLLTETTNGKAYISDRRWKKIAKLIKASAYYNGRRSSDKVDLLIIPYCIWDNEAQAQAYTKLFNEAYCEDLLLTLKTKEKQIVSELETLTNNVNNITNSQVQPSLYYNPFGGKIKGAYYRLLWHNDNFPICFINQKTFALIIRRNNKNHNVPIYYGKSLTQMEKQGEYLLHFKSGNELIDVKNNHVIQIELNDVDSKTRISDISNEIKTLQEQLTIVKAEFTNEYHRLKQLANIFFNEQFALLLEKAFFDQLPPIPEATSPIPSEVPSGEIANNEELAASE